MPYSRTEKIVLIGAGILLLLFGWFSRHELNPDAIVYIQISHYWGQLNFAYAVNGYWGPAFSWLILPLNVTGLPIVGAKLAMAITGLGFVAASRAWFVASELAEPQRVLGMLIAMAASVLASTTGITPDLLMSMFIVLAASIIAHSDWPTRGSRQIAVGALLGAAYLAKAIALPFAILFVPACAAARWLVGDVPVRRWVPPVCITLGMTLLVASPWIITLSRTYGKFTFSTSGSINHAIVGPGQDNRHLYDNTFETVRPGRVTNWEEPSREPYPFWSPFDSSNAFRHQLNIVRKNGIDMFDALSVLDPLRLGLVGLILGALTCLCRRNESKPHQSVAICAAASLSLLYLPVFSGLVRYFLLLTPFLAAAALQLSGLLDEALGLRVRDRQFGMASLLVAVAALATTLGSSLKAVLIESPIRRDYAVANTIVERLKSDGLPTGGFATVGSYPRVALDAAFLAGTRFNGREEQLGSNLTRLYTTGAQYVIAGDPDPATRLVLDQVGVRVLTDLPLVSVYRLKQP